MEAVVWLLILTLLSRRKWEELANEETLWLTAISSHDVGWLVQAKSDFISSGHNFFRWTEGNEGYGRIVNEWVEIVREIGEESRKIFFRRSIQGDPYSRLIPCEPHEIDYTRLDQAAQTYFLRFLKAGVSFLESKGAYDSVA